MASGEPIGLLLSLTRNGYTLTAASGSFTLSGVAATVKATHNPLAAAAGALVAQFNWKQERMEHLLGKVLLIKQP